MHLEKYAVVPDNEHKRYDFVSEGPKGKIKKVIFYDELGNNWYNLAFGDWNAIGQKIDDKARSNNNDRDKVLATVALTIIDFFKYHPEAEVYAMGSTPVRTRLYQIGIYKYWHLISPLISIKGLINGNWEPIEKHKNYHAFLAKAKKM
jgi:hypothetical protein